MNMTVKILYQKSCRWLRNKTKVWIGLTHANQLVYITMTYNILRNCRDPEL